MRVRCAVVWRRRWWCFATKAPTWGCESENDLFSLAFYTSLSDVFTRMLGACLFINKCMCQTDKVSEVTVAGWVLTRFTPPCVGVRVHRKMMAHTWCYCGGYYLFEAVRRSKSAKWRKWMSRHANSTSELVGRKLATSKCLKCELLSFGSWYRGSVSKHKWQSSGGNKGREIPTAPRGSKSPKFPYKIF